MATIRKGLIKRIHVDQRRIRENRKDGGSRPVFTIQTSKGPIKAKQVDVRGPSQLVHSLKPLSCGARVWIATRAEVRYS